MKPTRPRACEIEALAWATMAEGADTPPDLPGLLRRLARALLPARPAPIVARALEGGAA